MKIGYSTVCVCFIYAFCILHISGDPKKSNRNQWFVNSRHITATGIICRTQIIYDVKFSHMKLVQNIFKSMVPATKQNMLTKNSHIIRFQWEYGVFQNLSPSGQVN